MACCLASTKPLSEPIAGILLIGALGTNFIEILIEIHTFSFEEIHLKLSRNWRPFLSWPQCVTLPISWLRDFARSYDKTCYRILKQSSGHWSLLPWGQANRLYLRKSHWLYLAATVISREGLHNKPQAYTSQTVQKCVHIPSLHMGKWPFKDGLRPCLYRPKQDLSF